jgi:putative PEP-CTERM system TPR-repeat lipoprotein
MHYASFLRFVRARWPALSLLAVLSWTPQSLLAGSFEDGRQALASGDVDTALIHLKNAAKHAPNEPRARLWLGKAYLQAGDADAAVEAFRRALSLGGDRDLVLPLLGEAALDAGQPRTLLELGGEDDIRSPSARQQLRLLRGRAHLALQEEDAARRELEPLARSAISSETRSAALVGMARLELARNDLPAAEGWMRRALSLAPNRPQILLQAGELRLAAGRLREAETAFRKVLEQQPRSLPALLGLGRAELLRNRPREAMTTAKRLEGVSATAAAYLRGLAHAQSGDYQAARDELLPLQVGVTDDPMLNLALAVVSLQLGELNQAERYAARTPGPMAVRLQAIALLRLGDARRARELAVPVALRVAEPKLIAVAALAALQDGDAKTAARVLDARRKGRHPLLRRLSLAQEKLDAGRPQAAEELLLSAVEGTAMPLPGELEVTQRLSIGDLQGARQQAEDEARRAPQDAAAWLRLGVVRQLAGDRPGALRALQRALELKPGEPDGSRLLARLSVAEGDLGTARKVLDTALRPHPDRLALLLSRAAVERAGDRPEAAEPWLQRAMEAAPERWKARLALATIMAEEGRRKDLTALLRAAPQTLPRHPAQLGRLGVLQRTAGMTSAAQRTYAYWAALDPRDTRPRRLAADLALASGDTDSALREYAAILELAPENVVALNNSAMLILPDDPDRALGLARRAADAAPGNAEVLDTLGTVYLDRNQIGPGIEALERTLQLDPARPSSRWRLARAYLDNGERERAEDQLRRAVASEGTFPERQAAQGLLQRIGAPSSR